LNFYFEKFGFVWDFRFCILGLPTVYAKIKNFSSTPFVKNATNLKGALVF